MAADVLKGDRPLAGYDPPARFLHWTIAGLITVQFLLGKFAEEAATELREVELLASHRSVGITVLTLAVLRLIWRLARPLPPPVPMPAWQLTASRVAHWSLYALILVMPLTGWLMSSAEAETVSWFGFATLPGLLAENHDVAEVFEEIHETLAKVLLAVALVHIAAGLKHAVIDRDAALRRISSPVSLSAFALMLALGAWLLFGA